MNCVRCHRAMDKRELRGVLVDHCSACNGIWLDAGELEDLSVGGGEAPERLAARRSAETLAESRKTVSAAGVCPRCQGALLTTTLGGAEVDRCRRCSGLYFDDGELPMVLAALRPNPILAWWRRRRSPRS
jgi:Zn-finger nucleic acid-binding protein